MSNLPPPPGLSSRRAAFQGALSSDANSSSTPSSVAPAPPAARTSTPSKGKGKANSGDSTKPFSPKPSTKKKGAAPETEVGVDAISSKVDAGDVSVTSDEDVCFICAEAVSIWAVGVCGHRTCHVCSVRMRALFKKRECTFCKTECPRIVLTSSSSAPFSSFPPASTPFSDPKLGLYSESRAQMDTTLSLLRFNCPSSDCPEILTGWADLKRHVKAGHGKVLCDLCTTNKKIFSHEHEIYTGLELSAHKPVAHAECGFCKLWFYDSDALYKHCRDKHEECFVCAKMGIKHQYHLNYSKLEEHFRLEHYLCPHPTCLAEKFVVFENEIDLQAHSVSVHGASLSDQRARRDARRIETNFTYESDRTTPSSSGRGRNRGGGAGPATFVQEEAAPREKLGHRVVPGLGAGRQTQRNGGFRATLSAPANGGHDAPPHQQRAASQPGSAAVSPVPSRSATPSGSSADPETVEKHSALLRRVAAAVTTDAKLVSFKLVVRAYRGSELSAADLVDTLYNVFNTDLDVAGPLVTSLADLFEGDKKSSLLSAWNDLRIEKNSFPSLGGLSSTLSAAAPTRQQPRAGKGRQQPGTWGGSSTPSSSSIPERERFPALPTRSKATSSTPWAGSSGNSSSSSSRGPTPTPAVRSSAPAPRVAAAPPRQTAAEFPSLPTSTAEMERKARMRAVLAKPGSLAAGGGGSASGNGGWGSGTSTRSGSPEFEVPPAAEVSSGQGGKKKKPQKILLMSHGALRG